MSEGDAAPRARVERVIAAGLRIADPRDPLGEEARRRLPEASGLSPEGVALALGEHLEVSPSDEEIRALLAGAGQARRCQVVLSANVCTAALRAIAVAAATAPEVRVRPSRRDPVVAELLLRALAEDGAGAGRFALAADVELPGAPGDELHVYGSDATVAALAARAAAGELVRGHGTGIGVAVIGEGADVADAARALAADVVPFDQRGCLSPRVALVEGPPGRAEALAMALHRELGRAAERTPRGPLDDAARAEIAMYRATLEAIGAFWEGPGHGVGLDPEPRALALPPAARIAHVAAATAASLDGLIGPWAGVIAALGDVGGGGLIEAARRSLPRARRAPLGRMQRPPLDGPVDLRPR
ncbi:MAG TPA: acyl-CoA reductase [Candidatus Nanopelagicales bacterium]|nr:acyl-CoA reductase [Candidatus Nanopelagicales bacterium]